MNDERMIKLQHFFEADMMIKKEIYNISPSSVQYFDEYNINKYTDKLNDTLIYVFSELKSIALDIFGENSNVLERIIYLEQRMKEDFYSCGFDINSLKEFYENNISNMEIDFINSVKKECVGYTLGGTSSSQMANSVNEILHFMHSYVINNDNILGSMPLINNKVNEYGYPINLRGNSVPVFNQMFEQFPTNIDVGWTDMVTINENKIIMMVRDRGHALTIEVTLGNDIARMEYFIPKLCNIEMINNLPGVNKVNNDSVGATGVVEVPINNLNQTLFDFISKVPMDADMNLANDSFKKM